MLTKRRKAYLKLNIVSILFAAVSLLSVTLAWFAYSGLVDAETEIGVKAWYIEFEKDNEVVANDIVISLADIYPGMDTVSEKVRIKNLGDADAKIKYTISEARILDDEDDYYDSNQVSSAYIEDALSHNYPFHINIAVSKRYVAAKDEDTIFEVSVSWPLDSGNNNLDSLWGNKAYRYDMSQKELKENDSSYVALPAIRVVINVVAEQAIDDLNSIDANFTVGKEILYDVETNRSCKTISSTCLKTNVIDSKNLVSDENVSLLVSNNQGSGTYSNYLSLQNNWNVSTRKLSALDIMNVISNDIDYSIIKIPNISDSVLGNLSYSDRATTEFNRVKSLSGYFEYSKDFEYLSSDGCIWTEDAYGTKAFAYKNNLDSVSLYGEEVSATCGYKLVIEASKSNIEVDE